VHIAIRFGSFLEANAAIVGVANEPGELILTEFALHTATHSASAKGKTGDFDVGFAEGYPIGGFAPRGDQRSETCGSEA